MNAEEIRQHIQARPFRPFYLYVADGRQIHVFHHDFAMVSPKGRFVDVFQPDEKHDILDIRLITGVSFDGSPTSSDGAQTTGT